MVSHTCKVLGIIPARGGSKGIPGKNIRPLGGYPLIAYAIVAGRLSALVDRVIVSTDDEQIAAIARKWGAEVPFLRPARLARDETTDLPVFQHALGWLGENEDCRPDTIVQIRPTSPLRPRECVDAAVEMLIDDKDADSVRGVRSCSGPTAGGSCASLTVALTFASPKLNSILAPTSAVLHV